MKKFHFKWWKEGLHVVAITAVALLLTRCIIHYAPSLGVFAPLEKEMDFETSDIYNAVKENKSLHRSSPDVVVVSVDRHDRQQVLMDIRKIAATDPLAIGLDVHFKVYQKNLDSLLLATILDPSNRLVGSTKAIPDSCGYYEQSYMSYYEKEYSPVVGFTNMDPAQEQKVVRHFRPFVLKANGDTLMSMELKIASIANPEMAQQLIARGNELEIIDYTSLKIPVIDADDLDNPDIQEWIAHKVVMVGDVRDMEDMRITPLHGYVPGVMIHAYGVETILQASYIHTFQSWQNWLIAVGICLIFVALRLLVSRTMSNVGSLIIRISQFVIMYVLIVCGCVIFENHHSYVDFAPSVLMLGFGLLAYDIWFASYGIIMTIIDFIKKHLQKK